MCRKLITGATLVLSICFLLLGAVFESNTDIQRGISASVRIMKDDNYTELSSETIAENIEKYQTFNTRGTIFYILASVSIVICIISVTSKKNCNLH